MKTDDLIDLLARGPVAVDAHGSDRLWGRATVLGGIAATVLVVLLLGVRADLTDALRDPMFWVKSGFVAALAAIALPLSRRLARPGARVGAWAWLLGAPVLLIWALAGAALWSAAPPQRMALVMGSTWAVCPLNIVLLALPAFALTLQAMRHMAPTRPVWAGASSGLLAGAIGATAYSLHCPEMAAPFLAIWYVAGVLAMAAVGALVGARVLRW